MFHQVLIRKEDRSAQRFLWRGWDRHRDPDVYEMSAMTFGAACSPSSAQFVKNLNARTFAGDCPDVMRAIVDCHYMDDYFDSTKSTEEAIQLVRKVIDVHQMGGFVIRHWISNSSEVLDSIPSTHKASSQTVNLDVESQQPLEKTLGLQWDTSSDKLKVKISNSRLTAAQQPIITKRGALSIVMAVFDPLGLLTGFTVRARVLLQDIWRTGIGWEDELPRSIYQRWHEWCEELETLPDVTIQRCYSLHKAPVSDLQLHVFCDASEKAFGAALYWRFGHHDGTVTSSLVTAKARVAPLKPLSIPRLELQAALLGARLAATVHEEHDYCCSRTVFWSDSWTVICWLKSDARTFKPFVANRVGEIQDLTESGTWRWVPTIDNVADILTRGVTVRELCQENHSWFLGPNFLRQSECEWPENPSDVATATDQPDEEKKREFSGAAIEVVPSDDLLPNAERFSSWLRLVRTTAWVRRFASVWLARLRHQSFRKCELLPSEVRAAEVIWWKRVQQDHYSEELSDLKAGKAVKRTSSIYTLSPVLVDGVIRVSGRTNDVSHLPMPAKSPVILDRRHKFTRLLIYQHHVWARHQGQEKVMNDLRQVYWIPCARTAIRQAWRTCRECKNLSATPQPPEMGDVPACRTAAFQRPFSHTGVDYFGPFDVLIGRRHEKRYGVLFTCMTVRAVHLELASSLSTDSCILAMRRFIARRGRPVALYSDNGTNFHGAERELRQALNDLEQDRIVAELTTKNVEWNFNPPSAPHMGGAWERLIRSVKTTLKAILKERAPREEVLQTVLCEAEWIVNGRPLTHVSLDCEDAESLTPNHFLVGDQHTAAAPGVFEDVCLRKQWRFAQWLVEQFWKRWVKEYLPTLTRRTRWHGAVPSVKVGDVVVVADPSLPRGSWPKGVVTSVHPGRDGRVRVVDVKTKLGVFRRPVTKLCVLDVEP